MPIQLPQTNISPATFQPPSMSDLSSLYNRPLPLERLGDTLQNVSSDVLNRRLQNAQLYIESQKAQADAQNKRMTGIAALYDAGGPDLLNNLNGYQSPGGPSLQAQPSGQPYIPGDPNHPNSPINYSVNFHGHPDVTNSVSPSPSQTPPQSPQADDSGSPSQTNQTGQAPQAAPSAPQGQGFTTNLPTGYVPPPGPGHPSNDASMTPTTAGGSNGSAPATPDYNQQLQNVQNQILSYAGKGSYGAKQQAGFEKQVPIITAQMNDARQQSQYKQTADRETSQFNKNQAREAQQFATSQANEQGRARSGIAQKVAPQLTAASQLDNVYNQLSQVNASPDNKSIPFTGNLGAAYANNVPSTTSKWALNQQQAENLSDVGAGAIEKLVEGRYNDDQMKRIKSSMFPTGNQLGTPAGQQKLANFKNYLQLMKSGSINEANASLDSIAGGSFNPASLAGGQSAQQGQAINSKAQYDALPQGASYTWNGMQHIKGKS